MNENGIVNIPIGQIKFGNTIVQQIVALLVKSCINTTVIDPTKSKYFEWNVQEGKELMFDDHIS